MSSSEEFAKLAKRKSVLDYVVRLLMDRAVEGDTPAKDRIICEEVSYKEREVDQRTILDFKERLEQEAHELQLEMNQFTTTRKKHGQQPESHPEEARVKKGKGPRSSKPPPGDPGAAVNAELGGGSK
jgi:hypothetical protein